VSYVLNQKRRGGCGHRGCSSGSCSERRRPCRDFDPRGCCDCANLPDCFEGEFFRDPIFRGACAPDPEPCSRDWANNIYLHCAQTERLVVREDGGRVPFDSICSYTSGAFRQCRGEILLICGGTYLVFVKILVPANETLVTRLSLHLNGDEVPGTAINIAKTTTGSSASYELNAVISASEDDVLSLHSSNAFDLTGDDVLASITILKVN